MSLVHITLASRDRQVLLPTQDHLHLALHALLRVIGSRALLFHLVDDHLHLVLDADRPGHAARVVNLCLRPITQAPLASGHIAEVESRAHLSRLVEYVLQQVPHHGLPTHAALEPGSCFRDLVGARVLPGFQPILFRHMPRLRLREIWSAVGVKLDSPIPPATDADLRRAGLVRLREAMSAVIGVPSALSGSSDAVLPARARLAHIARHLDFSTREISLTLGISPRSTLRLLQAEVGEDLERALRLSLAIQALVERARPAAVG